VLSITAEMISIASAGRIVFFIFVFSPFFIFIFFEDYLKSAVVGATVGC
jgi:hypothetical protein